MNELKHIIYQITNLLNDMIYIGKHSTTTPYDMKGYWSSSKWLKSSIEIYGKKNFKRETLFVFDTENEAYDKEEEIVTPEFVAREDTYNLMVGGKGCSSGENHPQYGTHHSEEAKKKIGVAHIGKHHSEETKKKMSENHKGMGGKYHSEETKKKMSETQKGKHPSEKTKKKMGESKSGKNNPMFGKTGENHPFYGKHHSEDTKRKMSIVQSGPNHPFYGKHHTKESKKKIGESSKLSLEIVEQRRNDIKNTEKTRGWKKELSTLWNLSSSGGWHFIKKHASDLV